MNNKKKIKVIFVVGARPNFMKIAPLIKEISKYPQKFDWLLVHTGQHYDTRMSKYFFNDLGLPKPNIHLKVGSGTHAQQTGRILIGFESICQKEKPGLIIVAGDVNSTLACALAAVKMFIPIAHVEAGLRSFDKNMPEEINRILTDHISDFLFTTCKDANENLIKEGISKQKIFFTGNTMIDCLLNHIKAAQKSNILKKLQLNKNGQIRKYILITLHRPSNVDNPERLKEILNALNELAKKLLIVFPIHPRTTKQMNNHMIVNMILLHPLRYLDFIYLMSNAAIVLTDSGGVQEETTVLNIPCLTLRNNTERLVTIKEGTNILVGNKSDRIINNALHVLKNGNPRNRIPKYWDGKAAERIIEVLKGIGNA